VGKRRFAAESPRLLNYSSQNYLLDMGTSLRERLSFGGTSAPTGPQDLPPLPEIGASTQDGTIQDGMPGESDSNDAHGMGVSAGTKGARQGYLPDRAYELLPDLLAEPASRISDRRKQDVFLTGALPMWAGALSNVRFRYGDSDVSPNLYSAVVAPPASEKSALRHARALGKPLSEELRADIPDAGAPKQGALEAVTPEGGTREDESSKEEPPEELSPAAGLSRKRFFLAADTSAAALKERLAESPHGVICETEFRTLSQALESSWGKFSDVLLKGFQNEPIEMNRSSRRAVTIPHPAPSIALAGTPATFEGVISGTGDGLFSRFLFYRFEKEMTWSSQFGESGDALEQTLQAGAADLKAGYYELRRREEPLRITVPKRLRRVHDQTFASLAEKWSGGEAGSGAPASLRASLARSGLQAVKIAAVLRGARLIESGRSRTDADSIPLRAADMEAGLRLALMYLLHGVQVETRFREQTNPRAGLTDQKKRYLSDLPEGSFTTKEAKQLAEGYDVTARNVQRWLKDWREAGLLTKLKRGTWAKLSPDLEGLSGAGSVISVINDIPVLASG